MERYYFKNNMESGEDNRWVKPNEECGRLGAY